MKYFPNLIKKHKYKIKMYGYLMSWVGKAEN